MSKVADQAYEQIRAQIISGEYAPGSHLKEELIAEITGASRTPVREALRRLEAEHLVEFIPNRGAYVASWTVEDVEEIYVLRATLEGHAAFRAATRITPLEIATLRECCDDIDARMPCATDEQRQGIVDANHRFHSVVVAAAHSARLNTMLSWLVQIPMTLRTFERYSDRNIARSNGHHREMIDAFIAGDPVWAQKVMETHLYAAQRLYAASAREQLKPAEELSRLTGIARR